MAVQRLNTLFQFYNLTFGVVFFPDNIYPNDLTHAAVSEHLSSDFYTVPAHGVVFFRAGSAGGVTQGRVTLINAGSMSSTLILHEIGHQIFGAGHTEDGPCSYECTSNDMSSNFMCHHGLDESFTTCQSNYLVNSWLPVNCNWLMRHISPLPPDYESPDKPEAYLSADQPFLIRGCDKNRSDMMVNLTVVGGGDIVSDVKVRAKFAENYYDFDLATMGEDFNSVHQLSSGTQQNELRILANPADPWDGPEMHFTLASGESRTFMFKLKYNSDDSTTFIQNGIGGLKMEADIFVTVSPPGVPPITLIGTRDFTPKPVMPLVNGAAFIPNGNPVIIEGNFDIPSNGTFNWSSPLTLIKTGGSINVASGDNLSCENPGFVAVMEGCGELWNGINIKSGGAMTLKKAEIRDAINAVSISPTAGMVKILNTRFENNETGINIPGDGSGPNSPELSGLYFVQSAPLKRKTTIQNPSPNLTSLSGISSKDGPALLLTPNADLGYSAKFEKVRNGIILNNTDITLSKAIFTDLTGIYVKTGTGIIANNSDLSIGNASFTNCRAGLIANGGTTYIGYSDFIQTDSAIVTQNAALLAEENTVAGAKSGIGSRSGFTKALKNHFNGVKHGISTFDCTISIEENTFGDADTGIKATLCNNISLKKNTINAKNFGISLFHQNPIYGACNVEENTITMNGNPDGIAIYAGGSSFFPHSGGTFLNNTIDLKEGKAGISAVSANNIDIIYNHISMEQNPGAAYGISVEDNDQLNNTDNDVSGAGPEDANQQRSFYGMHSCRSLVACNYSNNTAYGFNFAGECSGKKSMAFQQNVIHNHNIGLLLGLPPSNGNAVIGPQKHHRNSWDGTYIGPGALHLGDIFIAAFSQFKCDDQANADFIPDLFSPFQWFKNEMEVGMPLYCNRRPDGERNDQDENIANGNVYGTNDGGALQWLSQRRLYERIMEEENGLSNTAVISDFIQTAGSGDLSTFVNARKSAKEVFPVSESDRQTLINLDAAISENLSSLSILQRLVFDDSQPVSSQQQALSDVNIKRNNIAQRSNSRKILYSDIRQTGTSAATNASGIIAGLPETAVYKANERTVLANLMDIFAGYTNELTILQKETLHNIAVQCPLTGGDAVLLARAILASQSELPISYADDADCNQEQSPEERNIAPLKVTLLVSPNPATNWLRIDHSTFSGQFTLYDILGKTYREQQLPADNNVDFISVSDIPNGVYFYRLSGTIGGKIIIQH